MSNATTYAFKVQVPFTGAQAIEASKKRGLSAELDTKYPIWSVVLGQLGWVRNQTHDNSGYAEVILLDRDGKGWIPRQCIDQGAVAGFKCQTLSPSFTLSAKNISQDAEIPLLRRVLRAMFKSMADNRTELVRASTSSADIDLLSGSPLYMDTMVKGKIIPLLLCSKLTSTGMQNVNTYDLFKDGQPSWQSLAQLPAIDANSTGGGIYMILYWSRASDGTLKFWWYVGKTRDFASRHNRHRQNITGPKEPEESRGHYSVAREAYQNGVANGSNAGGYRMFKV